MPDTIRRLTTAESENAIIRRLATAELEQQEWQVPANRLFYRIPIGLLGGYWSSTLNHKYPEFAWGLYFFPSSVNMRNYNHCFIQSVRLVR